MKIQIALSTGVDKNLGDLVELISTWVYKGHASKYSALGNSITALVPTSSHGRGETMLYRGLEMGMREVRSALKKGTLTMRERDFSSWTTEVETTCKYLDKYKFGVVVEWSVPRANVVLDLFDWVKRRSSGTDTPQRLGTKYFRMFQRLREDIADEREVIVRDAPVICNVVGLTSNNAKFLAKLDALDIDWETDDSGDVGYVALADVADHLAELGLT